MKSYEEKVSDDIKKGSPTPDKVSISVLKYFWQAGPVMRSKSDSIPRFLRKMKVLKNFSDNELRLLVKYMHLREFDAGERIFNHGNLGIGFYIIFNGYVSIVADTFDEPEEFKKEKQVAALERGDYFGELALLQERNIRNAQAVAVERTELLGIFKPDLESLINDYPIVATKLLQSISLIVSERLLSITVELKSLKHRLAGHTRSDK